MRILLALIFSAWSLPGLAQVNIGFGGETHDASAPVEITANGLDIDRETGRAVFSGNVVIVQGNLRMAAAEVVVNYGGQAEQQRVQSVTASGGVLVTRGEDAAEGERAEYSVTGAELLISGNVLLTQGPTTLAGDRLSVDMRSGSGAITGRVRTVLQSESE